MLLIFLCSTSLGVPDPCVVFAGGAQSRTVLNQIALMRQGAGTEQDQLRRSLPLAVLFQLGRRLRTAAVAVQKQPQKQGASAFAST
jgi:hypothetical protein